MVNATMGSAPRMIRDVDWKQVVFIAAGVPALVLFSMGGISATIGAPAWLVWTISVLFGFAQGEELSEHTASMPAVLHFLQGEAKLTLGDDTVEASPAPGSTCRLPCGTASRPGRLWPCCCCC